MRVFSSWVVSFQRESPGPPSLHCFTVEGSWNNFIGELLRANLCYWEATFGYWELSWLIPGIDTFTNWPPPPQPLACYNSLPWSHEIILFVCLQKGVKQCCYVTNLDCTHLSLTLGHLVVLGGQSIGPRCDSCRRLGYTGADVGELFYHVP